jgi:hypothetical protein
MVAGATLDGLSQQRCPAVDLKAATAGIFVVLVSQKAGHTHRHLGRQAKVQKGSAKGERLAPSKEATRLVHWECSSSHCWRELSDASHSPGIEQSAPDSFPPAGPASCRLSTPIAIMQLRPASRLVLSRPGRPAPTSARPLPSSRQRGGSNPICLHGVLLGAAVSTTTTRRGEKQVLSPAARANDGGGVALLLLLLLLPMLPLS